MKRNNVLSLISIAKKAGKTAAGEFQTENAVKSGKACVVVVSDEASDNTKKKFRNMCTFYEVPLYFYGGKVELGAAIGCEFRASIAVTDYGLGQALEKQLRQWTEEVTGLNEAVDSIENGGNV